VAEHPQHQTVHRTGHRAGPGSGETEFARKLGAKEARKMEARQLGAQRKVTRTIWSGFGMMGLVGWSVAVPALGGIALGVWLDRHFATRHSLTLTMLMVGLAIGCLNAWRWVVREEREMHEEHEVKDE